MKSLLKLLLCATIVISIASCGPQSNYSLPEANAMVLTKTAFLRTDSVTKVLLIPDGADTLVYILTPNKRSYNYFQTKKHTSIRPRIPSE